MLENIYKWRNRKKGFTLVELIVVMVIMAILLAILVPSMTQWIRKANNRQIMVNARTVYLAAQSVVSEKYGTDPKFDEGNAASNDTSETSYKAAIEDLAGLSNNYTFTVSWTAEGKINDFTYYEGEDKINGVKFVSGVLCETDLSKQANSGATE